MTESAVGLAPEGSGPEVRTRTVRTVIDGVETDVREQVIAVADESGDLVKTGAPEEMLAELRGLRRDIRFLAMQMFEITEWPDEDD